MSNSAIDGAGIIAFGALEKEITIKHGADLGVSSMDRITCDALATLLRRQEFHPRVGSTRLYN